MKTLSIRFTLLPVLFAIGIGFYGCSSKGNDATVNPTTPKYFLYCNVDGSDLKFEYNSDKYKDEYWGTESPAPDLYYKPSFGYSLWIYPKNQRIQFSNYAATPQAPGTFSINNIYFMKSRFVEYRATPPQASGTITITKVDDFEAEGTFAFTIEEDKSNGLAKVVVKNGRFKLKY